MWNQNKEKQSQLLEFLSQNSSYEAKFAALTLQNPKFSRGSEMIWLFISYLQLASQTFLLSLNLWSSEPSGNSVSWFIVSTLKLMNPGSLFVFEGRNEVTWFLLVISIVIALCKYMFFLYILYSLLRKTECSPTLIKIWRLAYQLQGRVLYSILSSIWVSIIVKALQNDLTIPGFGKNGTAVLLAGFLITEFIFCFVLRLRYYTVLPTTILLSSRSPTIEAITLTQKFILHILQIIFSSVSYTDDWVIISVCVIFSVVRNVVHFKTLPVWNLKGLRYQGVVVVITASLDIACFFQNIVLPKEALNFVMTVWIILSLLFTRISHEHIQRKILCLALSQTLNTSNEVIQKINIIQQLQSDIRQHNDIKKDVYLHLVNATIRRTLISSSQENHNPYDIIDDNPNSKDDLDRMFINYLESVQPAFPKDELLKLYTAEMFAKIQEYGPAMSILSNLQHSSANLVAVNATISILNIQEVMTEESRKIENKLNILDYLKVQVAYIEVQKKILQQMDLQIGLYHEMVKDCPDLSGMLNQGQNIDKGRQRLEKDIKLMMSSIPDYYLNPVLISGYYYLVANNSLAEFSRLLKIYSYRMLKYAKSFECENITIENFYQESNAFVLISGQKESLGKICFCNESLMKIYGGDINLYLGANVSKIAPLNRSSFNTLFSISPDVKKSESVIGQKFQGYCHHKKGHLIELEFYIDIFPILTNGFYYCVLIRQISTEKSILMGLTDKSILESPEKESSRVVDNLENSHEENKSERPKNGDNESVSESIESEDAENNYVKNSTVWKPDLLNKETPRRYLNISENAGPDLLASQRTDSALLTKFDGTDRKLPKYVKKKLDSADSQDQYRDKKDKYSSIDEENSNKVLENSEQATVSQTLNLALKTKFYWRPLMIAALIFYLVLLVIMVEQVVFKIEIDDTMNELKTKKDILGDAQSRDYSFVNLARSSWFIIDDVTGIFKASIYSTLGVSVPNYISNINTNVKSMSKANQNTQNNAGLLAASLRETLFEKDIILYINTPAGIVTAPNMTNFQAADFLAQIILKALKASKTNLTQAANILRIVVYNSLNSLLIKTESTTQLLSQSIESDTSEKRMIIQMTFMAFTVCLTIMSLIWLRIIFLIYRKEKSNMLTLIKLDNNAISKLQSRLDTFKKLLETGSLIENKSALQSLQTSVLADFQRKYRNRNNPQTANYGGIMKKYLFLATRYLLCSFSIIALMAWSSFSASDSIQSLHTEQVRMTFSNEMAKTNLLAYLSYRQLYSTLDTAEIRNEPVGIQLSKVLTLLGSYRNKAMSLFQNKNGEYDPLIETILFNPTCKNIIITSLVDSCGYLVKNHRQLGLVSMLSDYEGLLTSMRDSYYSSNKTLAALQALQIQYVDILIGTHRTLLDECTTITNRTNVIFQQKFEDAQSQTKLILVIVLILVPILGYGAWIFVFRQLQESDNKFKNVLKNFPANLILSNFLLKAYLLNTSRSVLEPIKSYF